MKLREGPLTALVTPDPDFNFPEHRVTQDQELGAERSSYYGDQRRMRGRKLIIYSWKNKQGKQDLYVIKVQSKKSPESEFKSI